MFYYIIGCCITLPTCRSRFKGKSCEKAGLFVHNEEMFYESAVQGRPVRVNLYAFMHHGQNKGTQKLKFSKKPKLKKKRGEIYKF